MRKEREKKRSFSKKKKLFSDDFFWLLFAGLWMAVIFVASSVPGSGQHYYNLQMLIERKGAHIFEFFVLAFLFWKISIKGKSDFGKRMLAIFVFSLFYAVSDEFHQLFVFGREGKLSDVGIDCIGVLAFLVLVRYLEKFGK